MIDPRILNAVLRISDAITTGDRSRPQPLPRIAAALEQIARNTTTGATSEYQIILDFEDADDLNAALAHIGDSDAPVCPLNGMVTVGDEAFALWSGYYDAYHATKS